MISDLHIGHKSILEFRKMPKWMNLQDHDDWIVNGWNSVVKKRDTVYVLGDICFDMEKMKLFSSMNGNKNLILGNHDAFHLGVYQKYFSKIHGFVKYKGYWLSHAPIHPYELRGRKNIHGHVHSNPLEDDRYIPVCVEQCYKEIQLGAQPMLFSDIVERTGGPHYDYER